MWRTLTVSSSAKYFVVCSTFAALTLLASKPAACTEIHEPGTKGAKFKMVKEHQALQKADPASQSPETSPAIAIDDSEAVLFGLKEYRLTDGAKAALNEFLGGVKARSLEESVLVINGYTCKLGAENDNQRLSEMRAESVKQYFKELGYAGNIITKGHGEGGTVSYTIPEKNRRVTFQMLAPGTDPTEATKLAYVKKAAKKERLVSTTVLYRENTASAPVPLSGKAVKEHGYVRLQFNPNMSCYIHVFTRGATDDLVSVEFDGKVDGESIWGLWCNYGDTLEWPTIAGRSGIIQGPDGQPWLALADASMGRQELIVVASKKPLGENFNPDDPKQFPVGTDSITFPVGARLTNTVELQSALSAHLGDNSIEVTSIELQLGKAR